MGKEKVDRIKEEQEAIEAAREEEERLNEDGDDNETVQWILAIGLVIVVLACIGSIIYIAIRTSCFTRACKKFAEKPLEASDDESPEKKVKGKKRKKKTKKVIANLYEKTDDNTKHEDDDDNEDDDGPESDQSVPVSIKSP